MSGLSTVVITACAACIICSLLSGFVTDGGLKRILSLVTGAFLVCSLLFPVSKALAEFRPETENYPSFEELTATSDEAFGAQVVKQTKKNLESTLEALLAQNGVTPRSCEILLAESENSGIIISQISIYIDQSDSLRTSDITALVRQHFGLSPRVITE